MSENKPVIGTATRQRSAPYPRYNLQQVEKFARVVFLEGSRNCDQDIIAKKAGYSGSQNGSFFAMRSAASQFGLVSAKNDRISVTPEWINAFHEDTPEILQSAREQAIRKPLLYSRLFEAIADHQLPGAEKLARTIYLDVKYGITKDAALEAIKTFMESVQYAGILDEKNYIRLTTSTALPASTDTLNNPNDDYEQPSMFRESDTSRGTNRPSNQGAVSKSIPQQPIMQDENMLSIPYSMEKQELTFRGGKKAYFIMPVPLPKGEKARLNKWLEVIKMQIELSLEDEPEPPAYTVTDDDSV
jgi:hypothetical protein